MSAFYDTSALLIAQEQAFNEHFFISSVTAAELEHIKTSDSKSGELKYQARKLVRLLDERKEEYTVVVDDTAVRAEVDKHFIPLSNDNLILASACLTSCEIVYSQDLCMRLIGTQVFGLNMQSFERVADDEVYTGYKQVVMAESEYATFLNQLDDNRFGCLTNEYLICYADIDMEVRECFRWTGEEFVPVYNKQLRSVSMGDKIKPKDEFQRCAIDSLMNNTVTFISGKTGSGKTLLALTAAMHLVDTYKYDRVVIASNPVAVRGVQALGYLPGTVNDKLLSGALGNILTSKFGDRMQVEMLIQQGKIRLLDLAACRGSEIKDNEILFLTEFENVTVDMAKIILSRVSSGAKVFVDGDFISQTDSRLFTGGNNGMRRCIQAFKGDPLFGYVDLPNIWRSHIAELTEKL